MSADAWAFVGGTLAALLLLVGVWRSGRSTDQTAMFNAAKELRAEGDAKLEKAWERELAQKSERVLELQAALMEQQGNLAETQRLLAATTAELAETKTLLAEATVALGHATRQIELLTEQVRALERTQIEASGGAVHES